MSERAREKEKKETREKKEESRREERGEMREEIARIVLKNMLLHFIHSTKRVGS